jgi:hypothetical protein
MDALERRIPGGVYCDYALRTRSDACLAAGTQRAVDLQVTVDIIDGLNRADVTADAALVAHLHFIAARLGEVPDDLKGRKLWVVLSVVLQGADQFADTAT